jgi:hypothetical protein
VDCDPEVVDLSPVVRIEIRWSRIGKVSRRFPGRWSPYGVDESGEADEFLECANLLALLLVLFESGDKSPHSKRTPLECANLLALSPMPF